MILRETFLKHPFDETITHYGHEDTLFGLVLKKGRHQNSAYRQPFNELRIRHQLGCTVEDRGVFKDTLYAQRKAKGLF